MNYNILSFALIANIICSSQNFPEFILKNIMHAKLDTDPPDLYLREWLNKLVIDFPNDLIKNETKGYIEDLTI